MTQGGSGRLSADRGDSGWLGVARGRSRRRRTDHGARGRAGSERPGGLTGAAVLLSCGDLVTVVAAEDEEETKSTSAGGARALVVGHKLRPTRRCLRRRL